MSDKPSPAQRIETMLENLLFSSRWILAPFYLGLALSLIVLLIKFLAELFHIAAHAFTATESEVILGVLALVDLSLTGSLIIIVIFSGYENFVSRIDHGDHKDWPEWMGKIDFSGLKLKLLSSIVAISAIQLLKQFMTVGKVSDRDLMWLVIIHVVFVVSSVFLALSDRLSGHGNSDHGNSGGGGGGGGNGGHGGNDQPQKNKGSSGEDAHGDSGAKHGAAVSMDTAANVPPAAQRSVGRPIIVEYLPDDFDDFDDDLFADPQPRAAKRTLN